MRDDNFRLFSVSAVLSHNIFDYSYTGETPVGLALCSDAGNTISNRCNSQPELAFTGVVVLCCISARSHENFNNFQQLR